MTHETRVLLVDDNRDAVAMLAALLTEAGCLVSYAFDPRLALAIARKCKPDVAFIDLRMPHLTGLDLARVFRAERALDGCALVALSGYASDYGWATLGADFQAVLSKPAQLEEIVAAVDTFVPAARGGRGRGAARQIAA